MTTLQTILAILNGLATVGLSIMSAYHHGVIGGQNTAIQNIQAATTVAAAAVPAIESTVQAVQPLAPAAAQSVLTDVQSALGRIESVLMAFQKSPTA